MTEDMRKRVVPVMLTFEQWQKVDVALGYAACEWNCEAAATISDELADQLSYELQLHDAEGPLGGPPGGDVP
ncbi:MAG: hypothetical protein EOO38_00870 [Cytophagaceae bacterium]|nr:MAG: hypothetical protein EOO38_00870 [Cytophagaceae bacterium]